jgi:hypothetical protein
MVKTRPDAPRVAGRWGDLLSVFERVDRQVKRLRRETGLVLRILASHERTPRARA